MKTASPPPSGHYRQWSDGELLSGLLGVSRSKASMLLGRVGGLGRIRAANEVELIAHGQGAIDLTRARRLRLAIELGRRVVAEPLRVGAQLTTPADVDAMLRPQLMGLEQEELHVLGCSPQRQLVTHIVVSRGTLDGVVFNPRDVFRPLLREAIESAIVVHNHPSGAPEPSDHDCDMTLQLALAGRIVGVRLLDHVIIARAGWYSFASTGALSDEFLETRSSSARMPTR